MSVGNDGANSNVCIRQSRITKHQQNIGYTICLKLSIE